VHRGRVCPSSVIIGNEGTKNTSGEWCSRGGFNPPRAHGVINRGVVGMKNSDSFNLFGNGTHIKGKKPGEPSNEQTRWGVEARQAFAGAMARGLWGAQRLSHQKMREKKKIGPLHLPTLSGGGRSGAGVGGRKQALGTFRRRQKIQWGGLRTVTDAPLGALWGKVNEGVLTCVTRGAIRHPRGRLFWGEKSLGLVLGEYNKKNIAGTKFRGIEREGGEVGCDMRSMIKQNSRENRSE